MFVAVSGFEVKAAALVKLKLLCSEEAVAVKLRLPIAVRFETPPLHTSEL